VALIGNITLTPRPNDPLNISLHYCDMNGVIGKAASVSMDVFWGKLIDGARWSMLLVPVALSFVQPARAEGAFTPTAEVELSYADVATPRLVATKQSFGPFLVKDTTRVELVGAVNSDTPAQFAAMIAAHPGLTQIDMVECPGSEDDDANLVLAGMIRTAGLSTHVPASGSIRSGGVELFLAGKTRTVDRGAEIGVHSWRDSDGFEATDYPATDAVHQPYIAFYRSVGMTDAQARAFYDFTNRAASFDDVHMMSEAEVRQFGLLTGG
jgi:hypothetical protein